MDYLSIINRYYPEDNGLRHILLKHSGDVAKKALLIAERHPELRLDRRFLEEAAMLHDIGIFLCDAPAIGCFGTEPYIRHGRLGAEILRAEGYPAHARVCERHTGAGLSREDIVCRNLPLPHEDFLPQTMAEKVICYADKFYSKSHPTDEKPLAAVEATMARFGADSLQRFRAWDARFR